MVDNKNEYLRHHTVVTRDTTMISTNINKESYESPDCLFLSLPQQQQFIP